VARPATVSSIGRPLRGATAVTLALLLVLANVRLASAAGTTDGFVTGGGWIPSPAGAYRADPTLAARGTFGLVAKHKGTGADGTTEFQLHGPTGFNFHSLAYEWLYVNGERARYGGTGTIAGRAGVFGFLVSVIDGDRIAKGLPDKFRIKVFDASGVLYDNQPGAADDADATMVLGEGSIVIHRGNTSTNRPPIANAGPDQTVTPSTAVALDGSASSDPDGDAITYAWTLITWPAGSAATVLGATTVAPHFTADLPGTYVVALVVSDGISDSAPDEVVVTATNTPPVARDDAYTTNEDSALAISAPGVLNNDSDAEGSALSAVLVSGPAHGTLTLGANGSFTYTPAANFFGTDTFTYRASDGAATSAAATATITVTSVNDAPLAAPDAYSTSEDTALAIAAPGLLGNDGDVDGDALSAILVSGPVHGTVALSANGSFAYTPAPNFFGSDGFSYRASDGVATSGTTTVTLTVLAVNDAPTGAPDTFTTNEDTALVIGAPGVLANDSDVEGSALSAVLVSGPAHGTLTLGAHGSFTYTPALNFFGSDSFTYQASDGAALSAPVTVALTVTAVNDAPVAGDDAATTNEDTPVTIDVLANDSDVDGALAAASVQVTAAAAHGTTTVDPATGRVTYNPALNFNGSDSFTYEVCDGSGACDTAIVTIAVLAVNDAPTAAPDAYTTNEDTPLVLGAPGVLANDSDVEGSSLSAALVSGPAHGTLTLGADGSFTYTPALNFNGADSFT
jgi:VCBS repeat-containing protein